MLTAVVGINWGDEGKGRMVDLLSKQYDVVCRYQGGNNAGHTVVTNDGKFILNLLPSGILHKGTVNVMGGGMVIDLEHLVGEIAAFRQRGIYISPDNLKISDKAFICFPYHVTQDILEEERLGDKKFGSTRRGIAPAYGDKYMKKGIRMGDLRNLAAVKQSLSDIVEWKNVTTKGYGDFHTNADIIMKWLDTFGSELIPYITDVTNYLSDSVKEGRDILLEAQLGALRDIDYGIYPYTTSSQTLAAYAPIGAGIPGVSLGNVLGVMKAYSSCVGEGPFTAEMSDLDASALREAGEEFGAATGRPRRVGGFDVVASRYGVAMQGADELALTKLDILSYFDEIPVCVAYEIDGHRTDRFPSGDELVRAKPVYEYFEGFKVDISGCRKAEDLPEPALRYIRYIEKAVDCPIKYVSVGPKRDDYFVL
ncbi:MAG: adenylosuccinate synthase [Oscillospiraceae bacterium]|nr:adenylosuccinate synthase [Oscillospiraceae bacterium]MCL2278797.1 adenylosuccinate synthase [Oscillospiraceae bacterium]